MEVLLLIYNMLLQIIYCIPMVYAWILYQHTKKHLYLYVIGLFFFYSIENIVICITEFDTTFARFYDITFLSVPTSRTIIFVPVMLFMLLILTSGLKENINYGLLTLLGFVTIFMLLVPMMDDGSMKVFIYYTPCQIFSFLMAVYGMRKMKAHPALYGKPAENEFFKILFQTAVFSILIIIEDWIVIFHFDNYVEPNIHIMNRSYTENLMSLYFVWASLRIFAPYLHSLMLPQALSADSAAEPAPASVSLAEPAEPALEPAQADLTAGDALDELPESLSDYTPALETDSPGSVSCESSSLSDYTDYSKFYLFSRDFQLTPREQHILELLLENKTNIEIGEDLYISIGTAKTHVHNIFVKVDVNKRQQLLNVYEHYTPSGI